MIAVDASGQARLDIEAGIARERFTAEIEIAKADFSDLGITRGNGFRDEVVQLRVLRGGAQIFRQSSPSSPEILYMTSHLRRIFVALPAPRLQAGDVVRVTVNGHFTLRGQFQVH